MLFFSYKKEGVTYNGKAQKGIRLTYSGTEGVYGLVSFSIGLKKSSTTSLVFCAIR